MNRSFFLLMSLFISSSMIAQDIEMPLWAKGRVPNFRQTEDKEKTEINDITLVSLVQEPAIRVFLPSHANNSRQAVVVCPGGGYGVLAYDWEGTDIAKWLNAHGIAAIVLKYRLPNSKSNITPHLSPLMDAQRAIRLTRHHAAEWKIDSRQVGIMGFSAGGHLASTAGTHFDDGNPSAADPVERISCRPDFMVLVYPVISMSKPIMHEGSRDNLIGKNPPRELAELYSNELQVTPNTPPTFLIHATDDGGVPVENSLLFYQALKDNKIPAALHIFPNGGHGFSLALKDPMLNEWTRLCVQWIRSLYKEDGR